MNFPEENLTRGQTIRRFEELAINAWPALQQELYDGWVLRFADGYTKRANSINPIYASSLPVAEKVDWCEVIYGVKMLPVAFKLTEDSLPAALDRELQQRGYELVDPTDVMILDTGKYSHQPAEVVKLTDGINDDWLQGFYRCARIHRQYQHAAKKILTGVALPVVSACLPVGGTTVGYGLGIMEQEYMGIFDLVVAAEHRGNGYGRAIMHALLNRAAEQGIKTVYLQVTAQNATARYLYTSLGFRPLYRYWYRVKRNIY